MRELITTAASGRQDDERGATAVEYGLMVALIAMLIIGAVLAMTGKLQDMFIQMAALL